MNTNQASELTAWEASFRFAAHADANAVLIAHLQKFGLRADPQLLLEGTIDFVRAIVAFATLDGRPIAECLAFQTYNPSTATNATYAVTFDVCGLGFARVLSDARLRSLDLADLYAMPWDRHNRVGYGRLWVSRTDGVDLSINELDIVEQDVTDDLRYDYQEDEIDFWFDRDTYKGAMLVSVMDHVDLGESE